MVSAQQTGPGLARHTVDLEVWADVACPWCYIGAARLATALEAIERSDRIRVHWRAFELHPEAAAGAGRREIDALVETKGMSPDQVRRMFTQVTQVAAGDGLELDCDATIAANTFDAHRLVQLAGPVTARAGRLMESLFRAHFCEGRRVDGIDELVTIAAEHGLDADDARAALTAQDTDVSAAVREDERTARSLGVDGVPFFVADRAYAVSGAQPVGVLTALLQTALDGPEDG